MLRKNNIESIDIGVMQTNWYWNKDRLKSTWQALDPAYNIRVGAQILRACYDSQKSWWTCTGHYHSPGQEPSQRERADSYRKSVYKHLREIDS